MGESSARPARNVYADFLRVGSICLVVLGHWLVTSVGYRGGRFEGADVLALLPWTQWLTLVFQVIPVFFLVGGYANAVSLTAHQARGAGCGSWLYRRAARLLMPTTLYVGAGTVAAALGVISAADPAVLATAGWAVALQLWFLPVYLILLALTPAMHAAHRRWGLLVPAVLGVAAVAVDTAVVVAHVPLIGGLNYVLVWGCLHQLGFGWQDRRLTASRRLPLALAAGGLVALVIAIWPGPYPVAMVGVPGARIDNPSPPSTALLAYAVGQAGLLLAAEPAVSRWLRRPRRSRAVAVGNAAAMTLYLWHMAPVVVAAIALYPTGVLPQPPVGSVAWWLLRIPWVLLLTALLIPLIAVLLPVERRIAAALPMDTGAPRPWAAVALGAGLALVVFALDRLAVGGFAPAGRLPATTLAAYTGGIALVGAVPWGRRGRPEQREAPVPGRARRPGDAPASGRDRAEATPG
jgi:fucose 4-O-acetylase-like acetyltransferase